MVAAPVTFLLVPLVVQASFFSFFTTLFDKPINATTAGTATQNSQRMVLLEPAVNLNPNPARGGGDIVVADGIALVAESGPAGTALSAERPQSSQISVYTVREGDTLSQIAEMFNVSVNTIVWANDIKGRVIHPGDLLVILPVTGLRHTVAKGETLESIAKAYNGDAAEIASYNELGAEADLVVGTTVIIPNGEIHVAAVPSQSSSQSTTRTAPLQGAGGPNYDSFFMWPVDGGVITQGLHGFNGVDIGAAKGTQIFASADGVVMIARNNGAWNGGYGNYVVIQHNNGTQTLYSHATDVLVTPGQSVTKGQAIATVGRTGQATGNHLHFEVRGAANPFR